MPNYVNNALPAINLMMPTTFVTSSKLSFGTILWIKLAELMPKQINIEISTSVAREVIRQLLCVEKREVGVQAPNTFPGFKTLVGLSVILDCRITARARLCSNGINLILPRSTPCPPMKLLPRAKARSTRCWFTRSAL